MLNARLCFICCSPLGHNYHDTIRMALQRYILALKWRKQGVDTNYVHRGGWFKDLIP
jgi:hypothetical protein